MDSPQDDQTSQPTPSGQPEGDARRKRRRRGGRGGDRTGPPTTGLAEGAPPPAPVDWKPGERRPDAPRPKREGPSPRREERGRDERGRGERDRGRERRPQDAGSGGGGGGRRGPREGGRDGGRETPKKPEVPAVAAAKPGKMDFLEELGGGLLQGVSRSFYLTIKLLPEPLRAPISLAYLIARTLDTIADAAKAAPAAVRLDHLRAFADGVKYGADAEAINALRREITAKLPAGNEKTLLENAPQILAWLDATPMPDRWEIRRVIFRIAHGQALDLVRFGDGRELNALATVQELDEYTYFVAGSVGEFWTRLCERHLDGKFAKLPEAEMLRLGKRYGQGLQLINILRDLTEDLAAGRSYLPTEELVAAGLTVEDLTKSPAKARKLIEKWRRETIARLDDGWKYVRAIREWKVRYACALPILIGLDTLALLAKESPLESKTKAKVKRSATAGTLLKAKFGVISQAWLDSMYARRRKRAGR
jgi:farnesyl-diphosphate farnesyltransferase